MYIDKDEKDIVLNTKKYLEIVEKIERERDCSKSDYNWLKTNSSLMDNEISNSLLKIYSAKDPNQYTSDEKYIRLLTEPNILQNFSSQLYSWYSDGFNLNSIKLIPKVKEFLVNYLEEWGEKSVLETKRRTISNNIFIVHGKNKEMKVSVARTLEKLGLKPIILHEQPNQGKTIIEKFEEYSNVGFAIILLSPDDIGYPKEYNNSDAKFRARQNVIFEFGYYVGKIGRENVIALYLENDNFEMPTDLSGILYIPYDKNDVWKYKLVEELQNSGYTVSKDKV